MDSNFIRIKHVDSGKEIIAEKRNLYKIMDVTTCFDTTDYELEVKKGEEIAIIREYNHCLLAKKKGIVGWIKKGVVENGINCK